jgi:hypothetical protein
MGKAMNDKKEMQLIYKVAKDVYSGEYSSKYGVLSLKGKCSATQSSIKMYFEIYKCMRLGKCYKMGTSEKFTRFLLNAIFRDEGIEEYKKALSAVKGNSAYRDSVNNSQPGLLRACLSSIEDCGADIDYESIPTASILSMEDPMDKSEESNSSPENNQNRHQASESLTSDKKLVDTRNVDMLVANRGEDSDLIELNIQPAASILNVFSRLSYKPWYAIAEFVDNSTQSYISHEEELTAAPDFEKLVVSVKYDSNNNTLTITDNAYGMELDRFKDAILLDSKNEMQSGRNEFGMGLKTAASWFGNVWSVISTQYNSNNQYSAKINIPELKRSGLNSIQIHRDFIEESTHGTTILIEDVTKRITASRTIGKIRELLSSMYRRDINNRNIEIWFNDEPIYFEPYSILTNFRGRVWKKDLDFIVNFNNSDYHITGFVGILNPGSFAKAGFALFRQDRVVVGGNDLNYKPTQIFGQAQSQVSLKLFGELNMNDFPVNQAKDGFVWDDGLEDAFIDALKDNIQEYITIARMSIKERDDETQYSAEASEDLHADVLNDLNNAFGNNDDDMHSASEETETNVPDTSSTNDDLDEYVNTVLNQESEETLVGTTRTYPINLDLVQTVTFNVQWAIGSRNFWIEYNETETDTYDVVINIDHPFFMPFSKDETFKRVLEKFTIAFVLSERQAKLSSDRSGYIPANVVKNYMNKYLAKLAEDNN